MDAVLYDCGGLCEEGSYTISKQEIELAAYCGLYCGDCPHYKSKFADLARDLENKLQKAKFDKYAKIKSTSVKEFDYYKEFCELLHQIAKLKCDVPCRAGGDGRSQPCEIKKCVQSKNLEGCWACNAFERCERFELLKRFHGDTPQKNLRKIKKYGLDKWAKHRGKHFLWL